MIEKVLVTGSSGFVGSHTVKYLSKKNVSVYGLDQCDPPKALKKYLKSFLKADISDSRVKEFVKENNLRDVIHCAALCLVAESVLKPELYMQNNVMKSKVLFENLVEAGVTHLVFSSTAATYGEPSLIPITEEHPQKPINPYGISKLQCELNLMKLFTAHRLKYGIVRYFNVAGSDPEGEIGESHDPETHLIPNAILALFRGQDLQIFGQDYPTRDGTCERDYIHVNDLANAHEGLLAYLKEGANSDVFNLGLGQGYTNLEVVRMIEHVANQKVPFVFGTRRPGDPARLVASFAKAKAKFNWQPIRSDLKTLIQDAYVWFKKNHG